MFAWKRQSLRCASGHDYPIVEGVPVLTVDELPATHAACDREWRPVARASYPSGAVHPYVQAAIVETCGNLYRPLRGRLTRYPIPELPLATASSSTDVLLDVGANWGRWCFAANARGYAAVGVDPNLEAVLAGRDIASQLNVDTAFVVADARCLPFKTASFNVVHSYSVLQHFSRDDALASIEEFGRVLVPGGLALVQLANSRGLLQLIRRLQNRRSTDTFRVRHWRPREVSSAFCDRIGPTELSADAFFSLNAQRKDLDLLSMRHRFVVVLSQALRRAAHERPWLIGFADSVYARAERRPIAD